MSVKRVHIKVFGNVQGVLFRANAFEFANKLGIKGRVKNTPDGAVEIVAEAGEEILDKLIDWCKKGPSYAAVEDLEVDWEEPTKEFKDFQITY